MKPTSPIVKHKNVYRCLKGCTEYQFLIGSVTNSHKRGRFNHIFITVMNVRSLIWVSVGKIKVLAGLLPHGGSREESVSLPFPA